MVRHSDSEMVIPDRGALGWVQSLFAQGNSILAALRNERLSPEKVLDLQNRKLRAMVNHAYHNTIFYRRKFERAGLTADDIQTVDDLPKLPPTTKQELRIAKVEEILARGYTPENTIIEPTSGSSGIVLRVYHAQDAFDRYFAYAFRPLWEMGYRPWYRVAYTALEPVAPLPWEKLGLGVRRQIDLRSGDPRKYVEALLDLHPQMLLGFPSIFMLIVRSANPEELAQIRPKAILLNSELLTDTTRQIIGEAFQCECYDDYSTIEFHQVAFECRHHRSHLAADNVIVEVTQEGQPVPAGEKGEILITGLTNHAMPLLRYGIGDIGTISPERCPCGRGFPVMKLVEGRIDDYITLPSGRKLSPRLVNPTIEFLPGVREHVVVQESPDEFSVYVNIAPEYADATAADVVSGLEQLFQEPVHIRLIHTTEFERGRTGKLRCVISKVK
ncbi:MAG: phenylacetate--CoA ligase family protein [Anaerolineae bacterium]|nr:phenylacetate--CoA ligase family protein [Anaerolineae bacterium]